MTIDVHKLSEEGMTAARASFAAGTKNAEAMTVEVLDYAKKSFAGSTAAWEKLLGAKTVDKAAEIQREYLKSAYEDFVAKTTKLGELYVDLAKEAYQPFEGVLAKATKVE